MGVDIDTVDLQILYHLMKNSREPLTTLGKKLNMTSSAVAYRVNKLVENGIITQFTIRVNHEKITPTFQAYVVTASVDDFSNASQMLTNSGMIDRILEVASKESLTAITQNLSGENLKELTSLLRKVTRTFSLVPILDEFPVVKTSITGESMNDIYCPLCQKTVSGEGIVTTIGTQTFTFCCKTCVDDFKHQYLKITESGRND